MGRIDTDGVVVMAEKGQKVTVSKVVIITVVN